MALLYLPIFRSLNIDRRIASSSRLCRHAWGRVNMAECRRCKARNSSSRSQCSRISWMFIVFPSSQPRLEQLPAPGIANLWTEVTTAMKPTKYIQINTYIRISRISVCINMFSNDIPLLDNIPANCKSFIVLQGKRSAAQAPSLDFQQHSHRCCSPADSYAHIQVGSGRHIWNRKNSDSEESEKVTPTTFSLRGLLHSLNLLQVLRWMPLQCCFMFAFPVQVFQNPSFPSSTSKRPGDTMPR